MLSFGSLFYYLLFVFIMINITILCILLLKNKSDKFKHLFIFGILLSGFIFHFLKLQFEPYASNWPKSLRFISFENVCAVSTLIFPWFYLSKNRFIKDYMILVGLFSGFGAVIYPYQSVGFNKVTFEIIRFYYAHFVLFLSSLLMIVTQQYRFNLKCVFKIPLLLYGVLTIILVNEIFLISIGVVKGNITSLLNPNTRNAALIFGPNKQLAKFDWVYNPFVPEVFKTVPFGPNAGETMYWPIIWLIIPSYIYILLGGVIINLVFNTNKNSCNVYSLSEDFS